MRQLLTRLPACMAAAACLALPSSALAVDVRYVDDSGSNTANNCTNPAAPCRTITKGLSVSEPNKTLRVGGGFYNNGETFPLALTNGIDLVRRNFRNSAVTSGAAIIDAAANPITMSITAGSNVTARLTGFTLRGDGKPVNVLSGSPTISGNVFDQTDAVRDISVMGTSSATIQSNTFSDPTLTTDRTGVYVQTSGTTAITNNTFTRLRVAISKESSSGPSTIADNRIIGSHNGPGNAQGYGIALLDARATIRHNTISGPIGSVVGIGVTDNAGGVQAGAALSRNRLIGGGEGQGGVGVNINSTEGSVSLDSDLIARWTNGLTVLDATADNIPPGPGDASVTNATIFDNGTDVSNTATHLTMDSSILEDFVSLPGSGGSCSVTHSRGPNTIGTGCQAFSTSADPKFVGPANADYHLQVTSPMVDAGNPAPPGSSDDIDGDDREADGNCDTVQDPQRDIGADELIPNCNPPNTLFRAGSTRSTTRDRTPTFTFRANPATAGTTFRCKRDNGAYAPCTSPKTYSTPFGFGRHTFRVKAISPFGIADPTPARRDFQVLR